MFIRVRPTEDDWGNEWARAAGRAGKAAKTLLEIYDADRLVVETPVTLIEYRRELPAGATNIEGMVPSDPNGSALDDERSADTVRRL